MMLTNTVDKNAMVVREMGKILYSGCDVSDADFLKVLTFCIAVIFKHLEGLWYANQTRPDIVIFCTDLLITSVMAAYREMVNAQL